jgi:Ca2+-binding EF-hand superfamily protein
MRACLCGAMMLVAGSMHAATRNPRLRAAVPTTAVTTAAVSAGTTTPSVTQPRQGSRLLRQWLEADRDADGALSRSEAARIPRLAAAFDAIDRDGDARLSADEVRAWRKARTTATRRPRNGGALEDTRQRADRNGDGYLVMDEVEERLPRLVARFEAIDTDRDGRLSGEEWRQWFAARRAARPQSNRDSSVSRSESSSVVVKGR